MAPRREKMEKISGDQGAVVYHFLRHVTTDDPEGTAMIMEYLSTHVPRTDTSSPSNQYIQRNKSKFNNPLALSLYELTACLKSPVFGEAIDISANLHNKVTKSSAVKVLKDLDEQNLIAGKAAGKQIVYHALQDPNDAASPEDIAAMDREITHLREEITTAKGEERALKANLVALNATMSTQDIRASLVALGAQKTDILSRLNPLRSGSVKPVPPQEKAEVDQAWTLWSSRANTRKKICMEVWAVVTEEMPEGKTKEELWVRKPAQTTKMSLTLSALGGVWAGGRQLNQVTIGTYTSMKTTWSARRRNTAHNVR
ncbi:hypothetical protein MMC27_006591 [Xylographa pallens]|nr:hypothetical protein [Xylographa pallens]